MKRFSKWLTFALALVLLLVPTIASAQGGTPGNRMRPMWRARGEVTAMPASGVVGEWTVNGVNFQVTADTKIDESNGVISVGVRVEAEGTVENGQKIAARVKSVAECGDDTCNPNARWRAAGEVTTMPTSGVIGEWTVNGVNFQVTAGTKIDDTNGAIAIGVRVEAEGTTVNGQKIAAKLKSQGECQDCNCDAVAGWRLAGKVTLMPTDGLVGDWIIAGQKVVATDATHFQKESELKVGATVVSAGVFDATGQRQANMIGILPPPHGANAPAMPQWQLFGPVASKPANGLVGEWVIARQTVITTADTRFPQDSSGLVVGATVHASGDFDDNGRAVATALGDGGGPDGSCGGEGPHDGGPRGGGGHH